MISVKMLKKYTKKSEYTYTLGAFPTFELLNRRPEVLKEVILGTQVKEEIREKLCPLCEKQGVPVITNDRVLERIREKEACIVAGVLEKYEDSLKPEEDHVVLVNPGDMGNLGTIIRTCAGFGIRNLAVIEPAADLFHPRVLRASMGSLFAVCQERFSSFEEYSRAYGSGRSFYPFMLKGSVLLNRLERNSVGPCGLIFGNEATGLPDSFLEVGQAVRIDHTDLIDSLNLSMAAGIAMYEFTKGRLPG